MDWIKERLAEPSTHAAICGCLAALIPLVPEPWGGVAVALFGALGFVIAEKKA